MADNLFASYSNPPSGKGAIGDFWLQLTTNDLWQKFASPTGWAIIGPLLTVGPQGEQGEPGPKGDPGLPWNPDEHGPIPMLVVHTVEPTHKKTNY